MKKVVTIGGGTGSFTILKGLKEYPLDISAIVSMADDGGSTGVLRDELGVLPPGDVRQCLVALSDSSEDLLKLMNYRFENGGLNGHSFGNLFLSALEKTSGSFSKGVEEAMRILKVKGEVIPVTEHDARLNAELKDGEIIRGEHSIDHNPFQRKGLKRLFYEQEVKANRKAIDRISDADIIVIGPGSHYTSIIPHLIIEDIAKAVANSKAKVAYVVNLTNKRDHTSGFTVKDYVDSIERYIGKGRIDFVICNTEKPSDEILSRYKEQEGDDALVQIANEMKNDQRLIAENLISSEEVRRNKSDKLAGQRSLIRHDSKVLAQIVNGLVDERKNLFIFDLDDTLYDKTGQVGEDYSEEKLSKISPFPEVIPLLKRLSGKKILVSNSSGDEKRQRKKIEVLRIGEYFDEIVLVPKSEDKREAFENILKKNPDFEKKNVFIIGDRIDLEIRYGNMLDCVTIYIKHGKYSNLIPRDVYEIPRHVITDLSVVKDIVESQV